MGQTPAKYFQPPSPYGSSEATNALMPVQRPAVNPQRQLLPLNFEDPGTAARPPQAMSPAMRPGPESFANRMPRRPGNAFYGGMF